MSWRLSESCGSGIAMCVILEVVERYNQSHQMLTSPGVIQWLWGSSCALSCQQRPARDRDSPWRRVPEWVPSGFALVQGSEKWKADAFGSAEYEGKIQYASARGTPSLARNSTGSKKNWKMNPKFWRPWWTFRILRMSWTWIRCHRFCPANFTFRMIVLHSWFHLESITRLRTPQKSKLVWRSLC